MVELAQLVRAPGCGPGGRGFESHISPQNDPECSSVQDLYLIFQKNDSLNITVNCHFLYEREVLLK